MARGPSRGFAEIALPRNLPAAHFRLEESGLVEMPNTETGRFELLGIYACGTHGSGGCCLPMFFFFSNGLGLGASVLVSVLLSLVLLYACSSG